jgi:hypothetical protein
MPEVAIMNRQKLPSVTVAPSVGFNDVDSLAFDNFLGFFE